MPKYVGRRIVPKHGGIWDKTKEYEELIIVLCQETGVSYISTVVPGDNLWKIAEKELGDGSRCADIRALNGLTSNAIRVGMKLLIP